jgi:hypothetical protein
MIAQLHSPYSATQYKSPWSFAGTIRHLATVGLAASDTTLDIKHMQDCMGGTFEAIATLAGELEGHLMEFENMGAGDAVKAVDDWKAKRAAHKANSDADEEYCGSDQGNAAWDIMDGIGQRIAAMHPASVADAAAILEWVKLDTEGGCYDPTNDTARDNVMAYLRRAQ